jgi:hypothetical protein
MVKPGGSDFPGRALRSGRFPSSGLTRKTPNPRSSIRSPRASAWRMTSMIVSTASVAFWRGTEAASATRLTMSFLITGC